MNNEKIIVELLKDGVIYMSDDNLVVEFPNGCELIGDNEENGEFSLEFICNLYRNQKGIK